jgi:hypothetical protein
VDAVKAEAENAILVATARIGGEAAHKSAAGGVRMTRQSREGSAMTDPKIISGLKERLMTSVTSVYRLRPEVKATDPVKRALQRAPDKENTTPRDARKPHDDVQ